MSPIPTPVDIGGVVGTVVGGVATGVSAVASVAPQATIIAEVAPAIADTALDAAKSNIDIEKIAMDMAKMKLREYIDLTRKYIEAMLQEHRALIITILVFLGIIVYLQISRKVSRAFGWFAYRKELYHGKKWLNGLDSALRKKMGTRPKDDVEKDIWEANLLAPKYEHIGRLFLKKPIPERDLCRAGQLRTDLECYSRRRSLSHRLADLPMRKWLGHLLWRFPKQATLKIWRYASWNWRHDWKAHKHDYHELMKTNMLKEKGTH